MNHSVYLRPEAERDIEDAALWYEKQQADLGTKFLDEVLLQCSMISKNPKMYPVVYRETRRAVIQRFPFGGVLSDRKEIYCGSCSASWQ